MTKSTKIVWNGCDEYMISDESVFTSNEEFKPFSVTECVLSEVPLDEEGDYDFAGFFVTDSGRVFKAA